MKLITERIDEVGFTIEESVNGKRNLYIEGVFLQSAIKNRNGRIYPEPVMDSEVERYIKESVSTNRGWGELSHPPGPQINPERISHRIVELRKDGTNYIGKALVTDTPCGNIVRGLLESGGKIGVSSRGLGSLKNVNGIMEVQNDFKLATAADVVLDPSGPDAWVDGIMESVEWVWENGIIKAEVLESHKKEIKAATSKNLEETKLKVWHNLLSNLQSTK